ncbi:MAG TPA: mechanosensitive ion channel family protein [Burkholderiales bacterium]|nr:mechanosensitive ion channel family protein [Burkholderiales bacterium]
MSQTLAGWSVQALAAAQARLDAMRVDLVQGPEQLRTLAASTHAALMSPGGVASFTYVVILLLVGIGVEWLFWTYAYSPYRSIQSSVPESRVQALALALRRLVFRLTGLLLFTVAAIGASAAFAWPRGVQELVVAATLLALVLRLAWAVLSIVLTPGRPRLRLVPVDDPAAGWLARFVMTAVCLLALGGFVPGVMERVGGAAHAAGLVRFLAVSAAAVILVVSAFAFFGGSRGPRFPKSFVLALLVAAVYAVWLLSANAATLAALIAIVIALQLGLRQMVFFFWPRDTERVAPSIALSIARFTVVLAALGVAAVAVDTPLLELAAAESPWVRFVLRLVGVATLALLTHAVWITVRTGIDQRLSRVRSPDPSHEPDEHSRLLTLLPLLRVTAAVLLIVMLVLSSLWALGIEITPLLAGAGVIGLAIGFGAQALVRDVISGIFYLAEDAFRIGEYIEAGSAKGTVERITLRTVALRHHNGPLHFVPYGSLGTVRNTSRDWVVFKFNLPLPLEVDSEKVRKLIKKVGEEMQADPQIGPLLQETLKGKLYRVDPGVKVFRCKFRTAPGKQFDVRAQAYKRIEEALKKMDVRFADGRVPVLTSA